jgi:DNA-binding transcriptional regulator YhcF (GntR family)
MPRSIYIAPTPAQRVAANHVAARSNLPKPAIKVFDVMVWMANGETGQLNPSQQLLADLTKVHVNTVPKAINELCRAGFLKILRQGRPHQSAAYQIQWAVLDEAQKRWELEAFAAMERHKKLRLDKLKAYTAARVKTAMKRTDIIPSAMKCSPAIRRGLPQPNGVDNACTHPQPYDWVNSLELYEQNSLNSESLREGEPRPETGSPSLEEKEGIQEEVGERLEEFSHASESVAGALKAIMKEGWAHRGETDGATDPRVTSLARLEGRSARKPWSKPGFGESEPLKPGELAA